SLRAERSRTRARCAGAPSSDRRRSPPERRTPARAAGRAPRRDQRSTWKDPREAGRAPEPSAALAIVTAAPAAATPASAPTHQWVRSDRWVSRGGGTAPSLVQVVGAASGAVSRASERSTVGDTAAAARTGCAAGGELGGLLGLGGSFPPADGRSERRRLIRI